MTMFKKILIANRGEIAVRVLQTCREMGIATLALYEAQDRDSLHVRLADECVLLPSGFLDGAAVVRVAAERGADAIHPGYGFLAEDVAFIRACQAAGITFIGPAADTVDAVHNKPAAVLAAQKAGIPVVKISPAVYEHDDDDALRSVIDLIGFPLVVKATSAGRGPGSRLVKTQENLAEAIRSAQAEAYAVFGSRRLYFEQAVIPAHQVGVQILADQHGHVIHLGEREGSLIYGSRKLIEEAPAPCIPLEQREKLWETALHIAKLFKIEGACTVEFLVDNKGHFYFSEVKARIQTEHPLTEMLTRVDIVREQIRIAAGLPLQARQEDAVPRGHAILCRVSAEDPRFRLMPSPGQLQKVRLPGGKDVRVDTHVYEGFTVSSQYMPLIAKVTAWGHDRAHAIARMQRALNEFTVTGVMNNLPRLQEVLRHDDFIAGCYTTDLLPQIMTMGEKRPATRDLAAIAAVLYALRNSTTTPSEPARLQAQRGWHRSSRRLPE
ncbi:MAG: ATP-grasp domain-containing protein [Chloroflexi bacterium]|nr:ATP-grasp domain-containing protein [Chloroflexota bacterium]